MKKFFFYVGSGICLLMLLCSFSTAARAQGRFGLGLVFGQPTGVAWNYRSSTGHSVDGALGFGPADDFRIHADYLWRSYPFTTQQLSVYYGPGAVLGFGRTRLHGYYNYRDFESDEHQVGFGVRGALGLDYTIPRAPIDMYLEIAPMVVFAPASGTDFDAAFGVRVYP